jgi:hypothetical protein
VYGTLTVAVGLTRTLDSTTRPGYYIYRFTNGTGLINWS